MLALLEAWVVALGVGGVQEWGCHPPPGREECGCRAMRAMLLGGKRSSCFV